MTQQTTLDLHIELSRLERFCQQLTDRSRDIARTHDALVTLETFITHFSQQSHGSSEFNTFESALKQFTETTRQLLLQQKTDELTKALEDCDASAVSQIHTPLSRNGFYGILQNAVARLDADQLHSIKQWCRQWTQEAKAKADALSPYPDAPDFKAAGIALETWLAMQDVNRYLESL